MNEVWVVNASPVIVFAKVGHLQLLKELPGELLLPVPVAGTERVSGTHPERLSGTHLGFQNSHSGQERQSSVYSGFRPFLDFIDSRKR